MVEENGIIDIQGTDGDDSVRLNYGDVHVGISISGGGNQAFREFRIDEVQEVHFHGVLALSLIHI